jgi:iron-sulfur cluster assembly protein
MGFFAKLFGKEQAAPASPPPLPHSVIRPGPIQLSPEAALEITAIAYEQGFKHFWVRLGIKNADDGGFTYTLDMDEVAPGPDDETMSSRGLWLVVDRRDLLYLRGTTLRYAEENGRTGFIFDNPNAEKPV